MNQRAILMSSITTTNLMRTTTIKEGHQVDKQAAVKRVMTVTTTMNLMGTMIVELEAHPAHKVAATTKMMEELTGTITVGNYNYHATHFENITLLKMSSGIYFLLFIKAQNTIVE